MLGSDSARHFAYLRKFQPHAETIMTQIRQAYAARDAEQIAFFAHKLKSSARTVGANTLADLCETLESAARDSNWTEIDGHVPALATVMRQVKEYIDEQ
jgi:HPt (histidine-containing phosphotransfer) domain-containing protein